MDVIIGLDGQQKSVYVYVCVSLADNPFLLHVAVHGLQRVKAKVPFPQFFSTMAEITPTTSLYLLWKYQRRQTQSL